MGLRVVARMYDRSEALVMSTCLETAGVPHWTYGYELICINPFNEISYDGFKIVVCDEDIESALRVLQEARSRPLFDGERLSTHTLMIPSLLAFSPLACSGRLNCAAGET